MALKSTSQYTLTDLNDIIIQDTPPTNPVVNTQWENTSVVPHELLRWTGNGTSVDRRYTASISGQPVVMNDVSDNKTFNVTVKTTANQSGSGTPSPTNIRPISPFVDIGDAITVHVSGKNIQSMPTTQSLNGITATAGIDGSITLNGTSTATTDFVYPLVCAIQGTHLTTANNMDTSSSITIRPSNGSSAIDSFTLSSVNAKSSYTTAQIDNVTIRISSGTTLTNFVIKLQTQLYVDTDIAYETPVNFDHNIITDTRMYGLVGCEDEISNNGTKTFKTYLATFDGTETVFSSAVYTNTVGINFTKVIPDSAPVASSSPAICSHFLLNTSGNNEIGFMKSVLRTMFWIPKTLLSTPDAAGAVAWVSAQYLAGTPVQVLYQVATPTTISGSPTLVSGIDGVNTISSSGSSITVDYTGSGWEAVGSVQRVAIENVTMTPEEGLKVETVLTSDDGTQEVETYFNARSNKFGLFRSSDEKMIAGAGILPIGKGFWASNILKDPDIDDFYLDLSKDETDEFNRRGIRFVRSDETLLQIDISSHDMYHNMIRSIGRPLMVSGELFDESMYPTGVDLQRAPIRLVGSYNPIGAPSDGSEMKSGSIGLEPNETHTDVNWEISPNLIVHGTVTVDTTTHTTVIASDSNNKESINGHFDPTSAGTYNLGHNTRWRRLYCTLSVDVSSDERLKQDITDIKSDLILRLHPRSYRLKSDPKNLQFGLIAQEVKVALDECGITDADLYGDENPDSLSLRYEQLIAPMIATIQDQDKQIKELKSKIDLFEQRLVELEKRVI